MFNHQTSRYRALPTKEVPEEQKDIPPGFRGKENPEMSWRQFFWLFELFEAFVGNMGEDTGRPKQCIECEIEY